VSKVPLRVRGFFIVWWRLWRNTQRMIPPGGGSSKSYRWRWIKRFRTTLAHFRIFDYGSGYRS
jgi:hypothetical protein